YRRYATENIMSDTKVLRLYKKAEILPEGAFTSKAVAKAEPKPASAPSPVLKVAPAVKPMRRRGRAKAKPQEQPRLSREEMLKIFRTMYTWRRPDDKEIQLNWQNRTFFQISGACQ